MNTSFSKDRKSPASLLMFAMMLVALGASQAHESARAATIKTIDLLSHQVESDMARIDESLRILSRAGQLTAATVDLIRKRPTRD